MDYATIIKYLTAFGPTGLVAGSLGGIIFYLLRYTIPEIRAQDKEERREERAAFQAAIAEAQAINRQQAREFHESLAKVNEALARERQLNAQAQNVLGLGLTALKEEVHNQTQAIVAAIQQGGRK